MAKPLTKAEKQLVGLFWDDDNYSFHRCDEHGMWAHRINEEVSVCPHCKKAFPVIVKEKNILK